MREFVIKKLYIPLHSVSDVRAKYSGYRISCIDATVSPQAHSHYGSYAADTKACNI